MLAVYIAALNITENEHHMVEAYIFTERNITWLRLTLLRVNILLRETSYG